MPTQQSLPNFFPPQKPAAFSYSINHFTDRGLLCLKYDLSVPDKDELDWIFNSKE